MRTFWITLAIVWGLLLAGAVLYASQKGIPSGIVVAVVPALLLEVGLYAALSFPAVRDRLVSLSPPILATVLLLASLVPWVLYGHWSKGVLLLAIVVPVAFWYVWLPATLITDLALLVIFPTVMLLKNRLLREIYPDPMPGLHVDFLGQLMWIRLGVGVMLLLRRAEGIGFGLVPTRAECAIGIKYFLQGMPCVLLIGYALGIVRIGTPKAEAWQWPIFAVGAFLGFFCVVALSEEFFLRGMLFGWLKQVLVSERDALVITTAVSGLVHLGFRSAFNWKFALVSSATHWFFGRAYLQSGGIRAGMLAHALTATTWLMVFAKSG